MSFICELSCLGIFIEPLHGPCVRAQVPPPPPLLSATPRAGRLANPITRSADALALAAAEAVPAASGTPVSEKKSVASLRAASAKSLASAKSTPLTVHQI